MSQLTQENLKKKLTLINVSPVNFTKYFPTVEEWKARERNEGEGRWDAGDKNVMNESDATLRSESPSLLSHWRI